MEQGARRLGVRWFDGVGGFELRWKGAPARFFRDLRRRGCWLLAALVVWVWLLGPPLVRLLRMRQRVRRVRRGQASVADATLLYQRMLHLLKRRGYQKPAWFTPREFASRCTGAKPGAIVGDFTATYNEVRFGGRTAMAPRLSILLDELERQRKYSA